MNKRINQIIEQINMIKNSNKEIIDISDVEKNGVSHKQLNHINNLSRDMNEWLNDLGLKILIFNDNGELSNEKWIQGNDDLYGRVLQTK